MSCEIKCTGTCGEDFIVLVVYRCIVKWKETMMKVTAMARRHGREWREWFFMLVTGIFLKDCCWQYTSFWVWIIRNQCLWAPWFMFMLREKGVLTGILRSMSPRCSHNWLRSWRGEGLIVEVVVMAVFIGNAGKGE